MVWPGCKAAEHSPCSSDCFDADLVGVRSKPLKLSRRSAAAHHGSHSGGLSRYYGSKSQSFSSLELVTSTPHGDSALALGKRPSSFDLQCRAITAAVQGLASLQVAGGAGASGALARCGSPQCAAGITAAGGASGCLLSPTLELEEERLEGCCSPFGGRDSGGASRCASPPLPVDFLDGNGDYDADGDDDEHGHARLRRGGGECTSSGRGAAGAYHHQQQQEQRYCALGSYAARCAAAAAAMAAAATASTSSPLRRCSSRPPGHGGSGSSGGMEELSASIAASRREAMAMDCSSSGGDESGAGGASNGAAGPGSDAAAVALGVLRAAKLWGSTEDLVAALHRAEEQAVQLQHSLQQQQPFQPYRHVADMPAPAAMHVHTSAYARAATPQLQHHNHHHQQQHRSASHAAMGPVGGLGGCSSSGQAACGLSSADSGPARLGGAGTRAAAPSHTAPAAAGGTMSPSVSPPAFPAATMLSSSLPSAAGMALPLPALAFTAMAAPQHQQQARRQY